MNNPGGLEGVAFVHTNHSKDPEWPDAEILFGATHIASDGGLVYRRLLNLTDQVTKIDEKINYSYLHFLNLRKGSARLGRTSCHLAHLSPQICMAQVLDGRPLIIFKR
jgi:hypothetical protein